MARIKHNVLPRFQSLFVSGSTMYCAPHEMDHPDLTLATPTLTPQCGHIWGNEKSFSTFSVYFFDFFASESRVLQVLGCQRICKNRSESAKLLRTSLNLHVSDRIRLDATLFSQAYWAPRSNLLCIQTYLCFQPLCHVLYETVPRNLLDLYTFRDV